MPANSTSNSFSASDRDVAIDYFKSYLVLGMILAHTISLLSMPGNNLTAKFLHAIAVTMNLICFPGFFFCFGYVNYICYFKKDYQVVKRKLIINAIRILFAYYLSAFASAILLSGVDITITRALSILWLSEMPGFSEFLIAFFLIVILSLLFFKIIKKATYSNGVLIALILLSLASSEITPYHLIKNNKLGLFIGTSNFTGFPVLPYLCYFLTGIVFAKNQLFYNWKILFFSVTLFLPFVIYIAIFHQLPSRFPPDIFWLSGSAFLLYICYIVSMKSKYWFGNVNIILTVGQNTLFYLLISNLLLFALFSKLQGTLLTNGGVIGLVYVLILFITFYLSKQVAGQ